MPGAVTLQSRYSAGAMKNGDDVIMTVSAGVGPLGRPADGGAMSERGAGRLLLIPV